MKPQLFRDLLLPLLLQHLVMLSLHFHSLLRVDVFPHQVIVLFLKTLFDVQHRVVVVLLHAVVLLLVLLNIIHIINVIAFFFFFFRVLFFDGMLTLITFVITDVRLDFGFQVNNFDFARNVFGRVRLFLMRL